MPSSSIHSVVVFLCCFTTNVGILVSEDMEDIFKSSVHIQDTLKRGNIIVQGVDVNVIKDKSTRRKINKYKSDIGHYYSVSMNWPDGIARHPIYVYKAVRDLLVFRHVGKVLLNEDDRARLPTEDDLNGAVNALLRLQVTYDLKTSDIASGIIAGEPSRRLYEDDCYLLGKQAFANYEYKLSLSWAEMGLKHSKSIMKELHKRFLTLKAYAEFQLGRNQNALETVRSWLKLDKNDEEAKELKYKIKNEPNQNPNLEYRSELVKYHKLCRGVPTEESNTVGVMSKMTCRFYDNGCNPQLILQPAREETINFDPYIVVYRDVISETEMIKLKSAASPKVVNYGIGGYYTMHTDWSIKHEDADYNERMATFLFYLNEVEVGGATVFPYIGVRMAPSKGDAILWYNLHRNGTGNRRTFHAACPVLLGTKWVANQWIGRHFQEFIRPCTLHSNQ